MANLFQIPFYKNKGYGHTGKVDGFNSVYAHFPEEKISYAVISNGINYNLNNISIAVLSAVYDKPYDIPAFSTYSVSTEDLDSCLGVYASNQIKLKITITKDGTTLIAQGTGQPSFRLEAIEKHKFKSDAVGATFEFNPTEKTMVLLQGGGIIKFYRE